MMTTDWHRQLKQEGYQTRWENVWHHTAETLPDQQQAAILFKNWEDGNADDVIMEATL